MNILVNGIGNLGTTLLHLLVRYREQLSIDKIYALKNDPKPWQDADLEDLTDLGVILCAPNVRSGYTDIHAVIDQIHYVFDTTNNGGGMRNRPWYLTFPHLVGASAQGSEKQFGTSFMSGINDNIISKEKFAHIVSCNTHSLASLLTTFCGKNLDQLEAADFVVVRRSEDLGNHQRLVSANVVARHLDSHLGTHHSIDVRDLFLTRGIELNVTSSDITTPSQLMHGVRFHIQLKNAISQHEINDLILQNPLISTSDKFDSNVIFERGRRLGFQGRIYSQAIIISNNLMINGNQIFGWAFIPQEANTLISTLHAFLLQTKHKQAERQLQFIRTELIRREW